MGGWGLETRVAAGKVGQVIHDQHAASHTARSLLLGGEKKKEENGVAGKRFT